MVGELGRRHILGRFIRFVDNQNTVHRPTHLFFHLSGALANEVMMCPSLICKINMFLSPPCHNKTFRFRAVAESKTAITSLKENSYGNIQKL